MPDGGEIPFDDAIGRYCAGLEKKSMTAAELDALAETVKQCHETMTKCPWFPRWGGKPGYIYSSGANKQIADFPEDMSDAEPRFDSIGVCDIRNALPAILAALQQAKADRKEVERLKGILKQTCEDQCQTEESIQADCARVGVVRQTSPECVEPIEDSVARLRAENERLAAGLDAVWAELLPNAPPQILSRLERDHPVLADRPAAAKEEPDRTPMICTVCGKKYIGRGNHVCSRAAKEGT